VDDDVAVEEVGGFGALDPVGVIADEGSLIESRSFRTEKWPTSSATLAHVVDLK
jgi:hypothetical protein